jgi:hypothetical protein
LQMLCKVITSMSSPMALRVVVTVWGNSGWHLDWGQTGRVGEEACDTLWFPAGLSVDILMLDISGVIVVSTVEVTAEILVL